MSKELGLTASQEVTVTPIYAEEQSPAPQKQKIGEGKWWRCFFEPGSAPQIIVAAVLAIAIGMAVNATVDEVPVAAVAILGIPGNLWLRALQAVGTCPQSPLCIMTCCKENSSILWDADWVL